MTTRGLKERLWEHKSLDCSSRLVLEHGNYEIYELEILDDELLLREREKYYIQRTDCVNVEIYQFDKKEYMKTYNKKYQNSEEGKKSIKKYYESEKGKANKKEINKRYREKKKNLKNSKL